MKTDVNRGEETEQILRLRCAGLSLRGIAARVGLSHTAVSNRITEALAELVTPAAEEYRQLEAARLNDLTARAYQVLDEAESGDVALKAIDRLTRLSESRRKLLGLDATEPIAVTFERHLDDQGHIVVDALTAALEVLQLGEEQRQLAVRAAVARLSGEPLPEPVVPVVDEGQAARAGMEQRLRELTADEDVDVDALLAEVEAEEGGSGGR